MNIIVVTIFVLWIVNHVDSCGNCCRRSCHRTCYNRDCEDSCWRSCCPKDCDSTTPSTTKPSTTTSTTISTTTKPDDTTPCPTSSPHEPSNCSTISNSSTKNIIAINNTMAIVNKIDIPITINVNNVNNLKISSKTTMEINGTDTERITDNRTCTTNCTVIRVPVPVPIPIPVVQKVPFPMPVPIPYPVRQPPGCCVCVMPCLHHQCSTYNRCCHGGCGGHPVIYIPRNPCSGGCERKNHWWKHTCSGRGVCSSSWQDCSGCNNEFYQNYDSYSNCHGCFSSSSDNY